MSKIKDIITQIEQFLGGADQSVNPRLNKLASDYAQACRALNKDLEECRDLIRQGTLPDAQRINNRYKPSLVERAALLDFSGRGEWCSICGMYSLEMPPSLDLETVRRLRGSNSADEKSAAELILEWRKIARSGGNAERVHLLRKILRVSSEGAEIWRKNLVTIEKNYLRELYTEADRSIDAGDYAKLEEIHRELCSPDLVVEPDEKTLTKIRSVLGGEQKKRLQKELDGLLNELTDAYSEMNRKQLEELMLKWQALLSNPLAAPDAAARETVDKITEYLDRCRHEEEMNIRFRQLRQELIGQLDDGKPYSEIDNTYQALILLDLPLEDSLVKRVEILRETTLLEARRRHIRHSIYGVAAALLVVGAVSFAIYTIQEHRTYRAAEDNMKQLIAAGNYQGAIELFEGFGKTSPKLAADTRLAALREDALKKKRLVDDQYKFALQEFNHFAADFDENLQYEKFQENLSTELLGKMENLRQYLSETQRGKILEYQKKHTELSEQKKREREDNFIKLATAKINEMKTLTASIVPVNTYDALAGQASVENYDGEAKKITRQFQSIIRQAKPQLEAALIERNEQLFQYQANAFQARIKREVAHREILQDLGAPHTIYEYLDALAKLETEEPELAKTYARAISWRPLYNAMMSDWGGSFQDAQAISKRGEEVKLAAYMGPVQLDWLQCLPSEEAARICERVHADLKDYLDNTLLKWSDYYELVFPDEKGMKYYFYMVNLPQVDRSKSTQEVRELIFETVTQAGQTPRPTIMKAQRKNNKYTFTVASGYLDGLNFPANLGEPAGWNPQRPEVFLKAEHLRIMSTVVEQISKARNISELENILIRHLKQVIDNRDMNPFVQRQIIDKLLEQFPKISNLYGSAESLRRKYSSEPGRVADWLRPTECADHPDEVKRFGEDLDALRDELNKMIDSKSFLQQLYFRVLSRQLVPVGLIVQKADQSPVLFKLTPNKPVGLYRLLRKSDDATSGDRIAAVPSELWDGSKSLTEVLGKDAFPGQIVYGLEQGQPDSEFFGAFIREAKEKNITIIPAPALWPVDIPADPVGGAHD